MDQWDRKRAERTHLQKQPAMPSRPVHRSMTVHATSAIQSTAGFRCDHVTKGTTVSKSQPYTLKSWRRHHVGYALALPHSDEYCQDVDRQTRIAGVPDLRSHAGAHG